MRGEKKALVLEKVIGMSEEDAEKTINDAGMIVRKKYHGKSYRGDCARVPNRITIEIDNGKVISSVLG